MGHGKSTVTSMCFYVFTHATGECCPSHSPDGVWSYSLLTSLLTSLTSSARECHYNTILSWCPREVAGGMVVSATLEHFDSYENWSLLKNLRIHKIHSSRARQMPSPAPQLPGTHSYINMHAILLTSTWTNQYPVLAQLWTVGIPVAGFLYMAYKRRRLLRLLGALPSRYRSLSLSHLST